MDGLGNSGGLALCASKRLGMAALPGCGTTELHRGRLQAAWVDAVVPGGIDVYNVYLETGQGWAGENVVILARLASAIRVSQHPFIVMGDFNIPVDVFRREAEEWLLAIRATV
eukprot:2365922-Lingulodinium_polyedra.AAC.1